MNNITLTSKEIKERRKVFFAKMDQEYPPVPVLVATNSGILEKLPETQDEWDNFYDNLQFVDGVQNTR